MNRTSLEDLQEIRVYICIPRRLQECGPMKLAEFCLLRGDDENVRLRIKNERRIIRKNYQKGV
jgi:hypothetical protein